MVLHSWVILILPIELWIQISYESYNAALLIVLKYEVCMTYKILHGLILLDTWTFCYCTYKVISIAELSHKLFFLLEYFFPWLLSVEI